MSFKDTSRKNTPKIYFFKLAFKLKFFGKKKKYQIFLKFFKYSSELLGFKSIE